MPKLKDRKKIKRRAWLRLLLVVLLAAGIATVVKLTAQRADIREEMARQETGTLLAAAPEEDDAPEETRAPAAPAPTRDPALPDVDTSDWNLRLVRSDGPFLEPDFEPALLDIERGERFDSRAAAPLLMLIADARAAGYEVYVCSCYRSYEVQYSIYWNHVADYQKEGMTFEEAEAATRIAVNYPGGSEHQLGLAADILESPQQEMEPWIGGTGLMLWLEEHCADYGFIIRYPEDKTDITGVEYEPWHLRYVGTAARYIMEHDLCLEEFLALYE